MVRVTEQIYNTYSDTDKDLFWAYVSHTFDFKYKLKATDEQEVNITGSNYSRITQTTHRQAMWADLKERNGKSDEFVNWQGPESTGQSNRPQTGAGVAQATGAQGNGTAQGNGAGVQSSSGGGIGEAFTIPARDPNNPQNIVRQCTDKCDMKECELRKECRDKHMRIAEELEKMGCPAVIYPYRRITRNQNHDCHGYGYPYNSYGPYPTYGPPPYSHCGGCW